MIKRTLAFLLTTVLVIGGSLPVFGAGIFSKGVPAGVPYLDFYAERNGEDASRIDLSRAKCLAHFIWDCESSYPTQYIWDQETIQLVAELIQNVYVTGDSDEIFSTGGGHSFSFLDEEEKPILSIAIQDGMIETSEGRYPADGLEALSEIPGVMTSGDWDEYYAQIREEEEEYQKNLKPEYPCSLFEVEGKNAFDFYNNGTVDDILSIYFFHAGKNKTVTDPDAIRKIYDSLCHVKVTGPGKASRWDDSWSITLSCTTENSPMVSDIRFSFRSGALDGMDEKDYTVEGLEGILESYDWDEFAVIADLI